MNTVSLFRFTEKPTIDRLKWLLLVALFLTAGAVGHDPWWKKGEAYSFGIIEHFYKTDNWLIPTNAGIPFMEKPPLYYWTAHLFCDMLDSFLPLADAARLASVFYMAIATGFLWLSGRVLFHSHPEKHCLAWICAALFLGTYGVTIFGHAMTTDTALVAGTAIALYGMSLLCMQPDSWKRAGAWFGIGMGVAFLSKGLMMPGVLATSFLIMILLSPAMRNRKTVQALLLSMLLAAPFFLIWPVLVYRASPELFMEWFWDNNIGRFLGFSVPKLGAETRRCNFLFMLPIVSFPVFPLAVAEAFYGRKEWRRPEYLLPVTVSLIGILILFCSASFRTIYIFPLLPLFALLATQSLARIPPELLAAWNKLARIAFSLVAVAFWIIWLNLLFPVDHRPIPWLVQRFDHILPSDYMPPAFQALECLMAVIVAVFWFRSFRLEGRSPLNTARIFFAGAVLLWCTSHTLLMPWINETKSFRSAVERLEAFVRASPYAGQCIANYQLGENMAPMVEYFMKLEKPLIIINLNGDACPLLLTFSLRDAPKDIDPRWKLVWRGTRLLDIKSNELRLYARVKN